MVLSFLSDARPNAAQKSGIIYRVKWTHPCCNMEARPTDWMQVDHPGMDHKEKNYWLQRAQFESLLLQAFNIQDKVNNFYPPLGHGGAIWTSNQKKFVKIQKGGEIRIPITETSSGKIYPIRIILHLSLPITICWNKRYIKKGRSITLTPRRLKSDLQ